MGQVQHQRQRAVPGLFSDQAVGRPGQGRGRIAKVTPIGRVGGEHDIKGAAVFFASEASRHITGQALAIDGGGSVVILN